MYPSSFIELDSLDAWVVPYIVDLKKQKGWLQVLIRGLIFLLIKESYKNS